MPRRELSPEEKAQARAAGLQTRQSLGMAWEEPTHRADIGFYSVRDTGHEPPMMGDEDPRFRAKPQEDRVGAIPLDIPANIPADVLQHLLQHAFQQLATEIEEKGIDRKGRDTVGATAAITLVRANADGSLDVIAGNAGDARTILVQEEAKQIEVALMTTAHGLSSPQEERRIEAIAFQHRTTLEAVRDKRDSRRLAPSRLPGLAITRGIGQSPYKPYFSTELAFQHQWVSPRKEVVRVLTTSDGLDYLGLAQTEVEALGQRLRQIDSRRSGNYEAWLKAIVQEGVGRYLEVSGGQYSDNISIGLLECTQLRANRRAGRGSPTAALMWDFDGQGGNEVAQYAHENFPRIVQFYLRSYLHLGSCHCTDGFMGDLAEVQANARIPFSLRNAIQQWIEILRREYDEAPVATKATVGQAIQQKTTQLSTMLRAVFLTENAPHDKLSAVQLFTRQQLSEEPATLKWGRYLLAFAAAATAFVLVSFVVGASMGLGHAATLSAFTHALKAIWTAFSHFSWGTHQQAQWVTNFAMPVALAGGSALSIGVGLRIFGEPKGRHYLRQIRDEAKTVVAPSLRPSRS
ncbi:MAG TPA: hypothetical protein VJB02_04500 [Coxiellaceae bacterium]|nr:hypothetical protein [Coxiellaceae bacterium]